MAEINIQKKKTPVWPWIVLALVVLLLVFFFVLSPDRDYDDTDDEAVVTDTLGYGNDYGAGDPVNEYSMFVSNGDDDMQMGREHEYTSRGLNLLAAALGSVIEKDTVDDTSVKAKQDTLRSKAEAITEDPESAKHADKIQEAALAAVDLMEAAQQKNKNQDTQREIKEARQAAQNIKAGTAALQQKDSIKKFFKESDDVVQAFSRNTDGRAAGDMNNNYEKNQ